MDVNALICNFPNLGIEIFEKLSIRQLQDCQTVCKTWYNFIQNEKFFWLKRIRQMVQDDGIKGQKLEEWKKAFNKITPFEAKQLFQTFETTYEDNVLIVAIMTKNTEMYQKIMNVVEFKNPKKSKGNSTPLHFAVKNGHFEIVQLILEQYKKNDKNSEAEMAIIDTSGGFCPLHLGKIFDHFNV